MEATCFHADGACALLDGVRQTTASNPTTTAETFLLVIPTQVKSQRSKVKF
jgi:hypothetical protein